MLSAKLQQSNIHGGYERLFQQICTSMYHQMAILENIKKRTHAQTDLYLEQSVICGGMLGYSDFLSIDKLEIILKLQRPKGCFGNLHGVDHNKTKRREKRNVKILAGLKYFDNLMQDILSFS